MRTLETIQHGTFGLAGRVAFVTGGNGGIGLGIAEGLARAGASVAIAARDQSKTDLAVESLSECGSEVIGLEIDVADEDSVSDAVTAAAKRFGRLDILFNNAGIAVRNQPQEYSVEDWDQVLDINLKGTFLCARAAYPHMVEAGGGSIVNIGSMTSIFGSDWVSSYSASKGGVVQLTRSLAIAWAGEGIRVNAILPGWIRTELTSGYWTNPDNRDRLALINRRIPAGRWGEPVDLAGLAVFLAGDASAYVTGAAIPVDGGYSSF